MNRLYIFFQLISSSVSLDTATSMIENGTQCSLPLSKQKRMRTLMRQERVTRKEADKDASYGIESERASPITHTSQAIMSRYFHQFNYQGIKIRISISFILRSPKGNPENETVELRQRSQTPTYLQLPPGPAPHQLIRQRSQPIQSGQASTAMMPASSIGSTIPTSPSPLNIPTLAVTPVSSAPNIVIEQYPTILRVVSIEEMNATTEPSTSSVPILARASSFTGKKKPSQFIKILGPFMRENFKICSNQIFRTRQYQYKHFTSTLFFHRLSSIYAQLI